MEAELGDLGGVNYANNGLGALESFKKTLRIIIKNPIILGIALIWSLIGQTSNLFDNIVFQMFFAFAYFLVTPFFVGGFYSVLIRLQGLDGESVYSVFIEGGKKKYISLLVGSIILVGLIVVFTISIYTISFISILIPGAIAFLLGRLIHELLGVVFFVIFILIISPLFFGLIFALNVFLQFYDIGIVALDYRVIDSFKESVNFVRARFNSVIGYTLIKSLAGTILVFIPLFLIVLKNQTSFFDNPEAINSSLTTTTTIILAVLAFLYLVFSFTYKTTYYVYNVVEERGKESNRRILLKLYGVGLIFMIVIGGSLGLIFYKYGPALDEMFEPKPQDLPFHDDFENYTVGEYPRAYGWNNLFSGSGASISDEQAYSGENSFKLSGGPNSTRQDFVIINLSDRLSYEYYVYLPERNDVHGGFSFLIQSLKSRSRNLVTFKPNGVLGFVGKKGTYIQIYSPKRWYKVHVDLDYTKNTADVYIDDVHKLDDVEIYPREFNDPEFGPVVLDKFTLSVGGFEPYILGPVYFDNISISGGEK